MYHRVAELRYDPWGLAVSPANFAAQLNQLRRLRTPLDLAAFVAELAAGTLPHDAVAISFDDGYVDNLWNAEPALAAAGLPATLFLTTGPLERRDQFWWDELTHLILEHEEPLELDIQVVDKVHRLRFGPLETADHSHVGWRACDPPQTARQAAYLTLWQELRRVPRSERESIMSALRANAGSVAPTQENRTVNVDELRNIVRRGTFTIGGHTVHHPALPTLSYEEQRFEISKGKRVIEELIGREITGFAYPYGALDQRARRAVIDAGFDWACSTQTRTTSAKAYDLYDLPRVAVPNVSGMSLMRILSAL